MGGKVLSAILATVFSTALALMQVQAAGLSGDRGKVRGMARYPSGGCEVLFRRYIEASGHSAFATTVTGMYDSMICGIALNKKTREQAEREAVEACRQGDKNWKVEQLGNCQVGASK